MTSLLDAEPVTSFCLARTRLIFLSDGLRCKVTIFCIVVDDVCKCSSLELSTDESVTNFKQEN
jgi:hypothetical protein